MEVVFLEGGVDVFHGGDEEFGGVVWVDEDLVADGDGVDFGAGIEMGDAGLDPVVSEGRIGGGGGEKLVGKCNNDGDIGVG